MNLMRRVYIASPCKSNGDGSAEVFRRYLKQCLEDSLEKGEAPYAPHSYLVGLKGCSDHIPKERQNGMNIGLKYLIVCNLAAFYADYGITEGMQGEMDFAKANKIPCLIRKLHV